MKQDLMGAWEGHPREYADKKEWYAVLARVERLDFDTLLALTKKHGIIFKDEIGLTKNALIDVIDEIPKADLLRELSHQEGLERK